MPNPPPTPATSGNGSTIQLSSGREVWEETRRFLAAHGLDWTGRPVRPWTRVQAAFEKRMIRTPTGGINGCHR